MKDTGERLLTKSFDKYSIEHLHRYGLACQLAVDRAVLDIASGEGYGANLLSKTAERVLGVDISKEAIEHARSKYLGDRLTQNLDFAIGSADAIPATDATFDLVSSFETLEHHDKHDEMMREIKRVLRPSGFLIISTPAKENYTDLSKTVNEFHVKELYTNEFISLLCRYFGYVRLYQQQVGYFGLIVPADGHATSSACFEGDFEAVHKHASLPRPIYNVAVASDCELPSIPASAFEGHLALEELRRHHDAELLAVESRIQLLKQELTNVYQSKSFRIGRILSYPLRFISGKT